MGLPAFHPPPGHIRSNSREVASQRRRFAFPANSPDSTLSSPKSANDVGSTQLLVPGVHPHPRKLGLIGAISRCEESRISSRRHGVESLGQSSQIHRNPAAMVEFDV
jgi:hypothetical protein